MKVFVTGPDAADSFTQNVAYTFREMGHDVRTDPGLTFGLQRSVLRRGLDEILTRTSRRFRLRNESRTTRRAAEFKPDLTVMCTQTFEPGTVETIRRVSGGRVVCWYGDSPTNLLRDHVVSGEYDVVFAKDPQFVETLRAMLGIEAHHLPEACNPAWHRPQAERAGDDVVVAGAGLRIPRFGRAASAAGRRGGAGLRSAALQLGRPGGARGAHGAVPRSHVEGARIRRGAGLPEHVFAARAPGQRQLPDLRDLRLRSAVADGAARLTEVFFEPGREYLAYADFEECLDHLKRLRRDYGEAREIRRRAAARATPSTPIATVWSGCSVSWRCESSVVAPQAGGARRRRPRDSSC